ncbi:MAG: glycosyltransferase family 39 protein [Chloroflexi bacterium]|nr:glycosyltransferase family 39 protein [Chloroflexota bacterium]
MPTDDVRRDAGWVLCFILLFLVRGVLYAAVTPPWQAPDEPRHLEYVLTTLDRPSGSTDPSPPSPTEAALIRSLLDFRWWQLAHGAPPPAVRPRSLDEVGGKAGDQSIRQPPAYYQAAAGFLRLWRSDDLLHRLLAVRLFSLVLAGVAVGATYATARLLFPERRAVAILATAFVALGPMPAFIGASANNDVLAIAVGNGLLLLIARVITRPRTAALAGIPPLLALGLLAKATALPVVLAGGLTGAVALLRRGLPFRVSGRLAIGLVPIALLTAALIWEPSAPAAWDGWALTGPRRADLPGPTGGSALRVEDASRNDYAFATQNVPLNRFSPLRGQEVMLTARLRCEGANRRGFIQLRAIEPFGNATTAAGAEWTTLSLRATIPSGASLLLVDLGSAASGPGDTGVCEFREVQLAPVRRPAPEQPRAAGAVGQPKDASPDNLVENGSGSSRRLVPRGWVQKTPVAPLLTSASLAHALDPSSYAPIWWPEYERLATLTFESYWGRFGWMTVRADETWYAIWLWASVAATIGLCLGPLLSLRSGAQALWTEHRAMLAVCLGVGLVAVGLTWLRFVPITPYAQVPQGRYLFPEIAAFSLLLATGLLQLVPRSLDRPLAALAVMALMVFDASSLLKWIVPTFYT